MKAKFILPYLIGTSAVLAAFSNNSAANTTATDCNYDYGIKKHINDSSYLDSICAEYAQTPIFEPYAVQAIERKHDVLYIMNNHDTIRRIGGTRAWRNMNPGNLRYGNFARDNGAIGKCGGFAVFPDEQTGRKALTELLRSKSYCNMTIERAISKYAPPKENNVGMYRKRLKKLTGLSLKTKLRDLDSTQMVSVTNAIATIEGWRTGNEEYIESATPILATNSYDTTKIAMINNANQRTL